MTLHRSRRGAHTRAWAGAAALLISACAHGAAENVQLYAMPEDLADAMPPGRADASSAAELAEGALHLLNPERPGGPDYLAAARMCLLSAEVAEPRVEADLKRACYRVAARSALRSGDRETYVDAVTQWATGAPRSERMAGELAIHLAIRDRLRGAGGRGARIPPAVRRLIPPPVED